MIPMKGAFSLWLVDNLQNEEISDKNSPYLRNCRIEWFGTRIRNWYVEKATCPSNPVYHLWYWNKKDSDGSDKDLLVYAQLDTIGDPYTKVGFYNIWADACISRIDKTKAYWLWPMATSFAGIPITGIKFRAEQGSFVSVTVTDIDWNISQQFDPSLCTTLEELENYFLNYPDQEYTHWKLITNGIIHVDFWDGVQRDMILNFWSIDDMWEAGVVFLAAINALTKWQSITTGWIKINGSDVWPINLSAVTTVEGVSTAINTAAGYELTYIRYSVNDSGERVPFIIFQKSNLSGVDTSASGQGPLFWKLLGGDDLVAASNFVPSRLQTVAMGISDPTIYSAHSASSYYLYSVETGQNWFFVVDNDYHIRLAIKPNGIRPKIGAIFDSFHFISGDYRNAATMYQSVRAFYEDFESPGSDTYTFDGPITALKTNNKEMYVFTKDSIGLLQAWGFTSQGGIYRYNIQQLETQEGALHQAGVVAVWSRIFYWTPTHKIKVVGRSADGLYDVADLSHRVWNGIDLTMQYAINADQSKMFAIYVPTENVVKWYCRSKNWTQIDMAVIYDIEHDTWLVDTYANTIFIHAAQDAKNAYMSGRPIGSLSTDRSRIYKDCVWALDDTVAYSMIYHTKRWMFGDPTLQKQFWWWRLFLDMAPAATVVMQVWIDGAKKYEENITTSNASNTAGNRVLDPNIWEYCYHLSKWKLREKGKNIQFRFIDSWSGSQLTIKSLSLEVLGLPLQTSNINNSK